MAIQMITDYPGNGMKLPMICVASWAVAQPDGAPAIDRHDPYYFEECYDAYASLQLDTDSQPGQPAQIPPCEA